MASTASDARWRPTPHVAYSVALGATFKKSASTRAMTSVHTMRYAFKPASVAAARHGTLRMRQQRATMRVPTAGGVVKFDGQTEAHKTTEFALICDRDGRWRLERLACNIKNLTLRRVSDRPPSATRPADPSAAAPPSAPLPPPPSSSSPPPERCVAPTAASAPHPSSAAPPVGQSAPAATEGSSIDGAGSAAGEDADVDLDALFGGEGSDAGDGGAAADEDADIDPDALFGDDCSDGDGGAPAAAERAGTHDEDDRESLFGGEDWDDEAAGIAAAEDDAEVDPELLFGGDGESDSAWDATD
jgi:hypothetical protein